MVEKQWQFGGLLNRVKNSYYRFFVDILGFRQIILDFQTGPPGRPACCADKGCPV